MSGKYRLLLATAVLGLLTTLSAPIAVGASGADAYQENDKLVLTPASGRVEVRFLEKGAIEVQMPAPESDFPTEMTVPDSLKPTAFTFDRANATATGNGLKVKYSLEPFALTFVDGSGKRLLQLADNGIIKKSDGSYQLSFKKSPDDGFYGLGESFAGWGPNFFFNQKIGLNRNGQRVQIWTRHRPPSDMGMPFFLSPRGYGLLVDNPFKAEFDLTGADRFVYSAGGGPLKFYVFTGKEPYAVLDAYSQLTGRPPIPPSWLTGYMQSRCGYSGEAEFRSLMDNFRSRHLPCDTLVFDLDWYTHGSTKNTPTIPMGELAWAPEQFKDPVAFQKEMAGRGFKSMVIIQPYVVKSSKNFEAALPLAVKNSSGQPYGPFVLWGQIKSSLMLDFSNPAARQWLGQKIFDLHATGIDAWWTDLTEPEIDFPDMIFYGGRSRDSGHNLQALDMHKGIWEMYRAKLPEERVFIMSRGGFIGDWRYGTSIWSGDITSFWNHLKNQPAVGIGAGLSGFGLWNSDVGGFHGTPSTELYERWMEFGAFCPVFRAHGDRSIREPWAFGPRAEKELRDLLNLRYRLSPYLYTLFREMHDSGKPVMRALFLEFPSDKTAWRQNDEYMYGPALLAAPVTVPAARWRTVYLPAGVWTDFYTEKRIKGPARILASAPLDHIPLFAREGAIIPLGPVVQYIGEKPVNPLTIHIYPGSASSSYKIYDDDGTSYKYENGEFRFLPVEYVPGAQSSIRIGPASGKWQGMANPNYIIVVHNAARPSSVTLNGAEVSQSSADVESGANASAAYSYDGAKKLLKIFAPAGEEIRIGIR